MAMWKFWNWVFGLILIYIGLSRSISQSILFFDPAFTSYIFLGLGIIMFFLAPPKKLLISGSGGYGSTINNGLRHYFVRFVAIVLFFAGLLSVLGDFGISVTLTAIVVRTFEQAIFNLLIALVGLIFILMAHRRTDIPLGGMSGYAHP